MLPLPREDSAASGCYRTRDREEHLVAIQLRVEHLHVRLQLVESIRHGVTRDHGCGVFDADADRVRAAYRVIELELMGCSLPPMDRLVHP